MAGPLAVVVRFRFLSKYAGPMACASIWARLIGEGKDTAVVVVGQRASEEPITVPFSRAKAPANPAGVVEVGGTRPIFEFVTRKIQGINIER